jgi:hypothetical protein
MTSSVWASVRRFFPVFGLCLVPQLSVAGSHTYQQNVAVMDGKPSLRLTNSSELPITAYVMVEFPSLGMEGRTYFDIYTDWHRQPILPGASTTSYLSFFRGSDLAKVRAEIRAVIFEDGSTAGDPVWVNAILARRLRFYDRLLNLLDLLTPKVGSGISREGIVASLRAAQSDTDKQTPNDDLRVIDDNTFYAAISTFIANRKVSTEVTLRAYLKYLINRAAKMESSQPDLATIRTLPVKTPKPLSQASLPTDFRAAAAALSSKKVVNPATGGLSSCSVLGADFEYPATASGTCYDEDGDPIGVLYNDYPTFSNKDFEYYDASTGKTTTMQWSWTNGGDDLSTAVSACTNYYDCDGDYDAFYKEGFASGQGAALFSASQTVEEGENDSSFYWHFNYWDTQLSACDPGCSNNLYDDPVAVDVGGDSTTFYFSWDCAVSP